MSAIPVEGEFDWMQDGNCRGLPPDDFFPERGMPTAPAKAVCAGCVVSDECLEYALQSGEKHGIWGGRSERERRLIRQQRERSRRFG